MINYLKSKLPEIENLQLIKASHDEEIQEALLKYENSMICKTYKFGIILVKEGQNDENQYFSNGKGEILAGKSLSVVDTTPAFERFLDFLGERVRLKGWTGFRGGLDVKSEPLQRAISPSLTRCR